MALSWQPDAQQACRWLLLLLPHSLSNANDSFGKEIHCPQSNCHASRKHLAACKTVKHSQVPQSPHCWHQAVPKTQQSDMENSSPQQRVPERWCEKRLQNPTPSDIQDLTWIQEIKKKCQCPNRDISMRAVEVTPRRQVINIQTVADIEL